MAVEHPQPVEVEEGREELKAVLQSQVFQHAPRLAHLLSHLCEKTFAGEAHQIKEYSIGVEVFRRGPAFDQESDSIVRVEINRLRKRLAEYYAAEGASHRLRITIPIGQYVPEFRNIAPAPSPLPESTEPAPAPEPTRPPPWNSAAIRAGAALLAMLLIAAAFWLATRTREKPEQAATAAPAAAPVNPDTFIGPPVGEEVRILAGSSRSYVDHAGKLWSADAYFTGGTALRNETRHIRRTQDPSFFHASREGRFRYDIPLKTGLYELHMLFAETVYGPENSGTGGEGSRLMTVRANGRPLLTHFDVFADAGGGGIADVRVFPDLSPTSDGKLHLDFAAEDGKSATLSAIEILPGLRGHMRPVRILARQNPYYDNDSHWWSPDNYFDGGQLAAYPDPVVGTDDPELYESERWGNFSYAIPASPGRYTVRLHFTARHRGWNLPSASEEPSAPVDHAPEHVFDVLCNGRTLLRNFDLLHETRHGDVVIRTAAGLEPNAQGKLLLSFVPVRGYASVTGIEVIPQ